MDESRLNQLKNEFAPLGDFETNNSAVVGLFINEQSLRRKIILGFKNQGCCDSAATLKADLFIEEVEQLTDRAKNDRIEIFLERFVNNTQKP